MFEDIIGSNKPRLRFNLKAELEKNGEMVPEATVDIYRDEPVLTGHITCPGMKVTEEDHFCLYLSTYKGMPIGQYPVPIFVEEKEVNGKFKFTLARAKAAGTP